jgi:hypothetical protein
MTLISTIPKSAATGPVLYSWRLPTPPLSREQGPPGCVAARPRSAILGKTGDRPWTRGVIGISHHNPVMDLKMAAASGIWGVIHKATQGRAYAAPDYARHGEMAASVGLLWGAYHSNTGDNAQSQVKGFIDKARPDDKTLMVLDYEDNRLSQMNIHQAVEFLQALEQQLGRKGAILIASYCNAIYSPTAIIGDLDRLTQGWTTALLRGQEAARLRPGRVQGIDHHSRLDRGFPGATHSEPDRACPRRLLFGHGARLERAAAAVDRRVPDRCRDPDGRGLCRRMVEVARPSLISKVML